MARTGGGGKYTMPKVRCRRCDGTAIEVTLGTRRAFVCWSCGQCWGDADLLAAVADLAAGQPAARTTP